MIMMWHEQEEKRVLENWLDKFDALCGACNIKT